MMLMMSHVIFNMARRRSCSCRRFSILFGLEDLFKSGQVILSEADPFGLLEDAAHGVLKDSIGPQ